MPAQKLSLKPVEKHLKGILLKLQAQAKKTTLTKQQTKVLQRDIKNIKRLIADLPDDCHKSQPYDIGI